MKKLSSVFFALVLSTLTQTSSAQQNPPFKLKEISYGIYTSRTIAREAIADSVSISHGQVAGQTLVTQTDQVPAKLGTQFGSEYQLTGSAKDSVTLEIEWIYPREVNDTVKHTHYRSIRYPIVMPANAANASSYSLDENFELIRGIWILNIFSDNKKIFTRKFHLN